MAKPYADLSDAAIDLEYIREFATRSLLTALDARRGRKALVLDPRLGGPLSQICQFSTLRQHNVEKLYALEGGGLDTDCPQVVFLVRPRLELMHTLAEVVKSVLDDVREARAAHVKAYGGAKRRSANDDEAGEEDGVPPLPEVPNFSVLFLPRKTLVCEELLKHLGVYGDLSLSEVPVDIIPYERDVLSIEHETAYRDLAVESDNSSLFYVARAIHRLQRVTGEAPLVKGKGPAAKEVAEIIERLRREAVAEAAAEADSWNSDDSGDEGGGEGGGEEGADLWNFSVGGLRSGPPPRGKDIPMPVTPQVDMILLLDREVDMVTPLCTQLTYGGFIDEIIGVKNGAIEVPDDDGQNIKARLNSSDPLFKELRDLNFGRACDALRDKSSAIQADYRSIKGGKVEEQDVSEIAGFVRKLKDNMQGAGLQLHATIAKHLLDSTRGAMLYQQRFMNNLEVERACVEGHSWDNTLEHIETMIFRGEHVRDVARMLALASLTYGGVPKKNYEPLKREMLHAYGPQVLLLLINMETAGLLFRREDKPRGGFPAVRRQLNLVVDDLDDMNPADVAYAYSHSGYAPMSVRLAQAAVRGPWKVVEESLKALPGPHFEYSQGHDESGAPAVLAANYTVWMRGAQSKRVRPVALKTKLRKRAIVSNLDS